MNLTPTCDLFVVCGEPSGDAYAAAIVEATTHYRDAQIIAKVSRGLGSAMRGQEISELDVKLAERGW